MRVALRALTFLRPKLAAKGVDYTGADMTLDDGATVATLIARCGLEQHEVEAAFLNHRTVPRETELHDGDEVVLVPPGTPGPHRYLLGIAKRPKRAGAD